MLRSSLRIGFFALMTAFGGPGVAIAQEAPLLPVERSLRDGSFPGNTDASSRRVALVIGIGDYAYTSKLRNPRSDAQAMAGLLRQHGFHVIEGYDLDKPRIEALLRETVVASGRNAEIVVFFSGHGIQVADRSYLLPIEARLSDVTDLPFQTLALDSVLSILRTSSDVQVSFLDACRNNPFQGGQAMSTVRGTLSPIEQGFTQPQAPFNGLLAYAAEPGALAFDGDGNHSPYTQALLSAAEISPDSSIETLLSAVQRFVQDGTGGQQVPVWSSALSRPFALRPPVEPPAIPAPVIASVPAQAALPVQPVVSSGVVTAPTAAVPVTGGYGTPASGAAGEIVAPRERLVALGQRLLRLLGLGSDARVSVSRMPAQGTLGILTRSGDIAELPRRPLDAGEVASLVLRLEGVSARGTGANGVGREMLGFDVSGSRVDVPLSLVPNACDVEAGDWFDPQGVGLHRLDSALRPSRAIAECQRALANDPGNVRYRFQLARGLKASGNGPAEALFLQAAEGGHARAWLAYGEMRLSRGDLAGADAAFRRGREAGDPLASVALGALRLRSAPGDAGRQDAYEMLTEGVDLGLWEAMDVLARYYADPASPDADTRRAQRFALEASRRRNAIPPASVTAPTSPPALPETDLPGQGRSGGDGGRDSTDRQ